MTERQLRLLRTFVQAEIEHALATHEEGEDGYRQSGWQERRAADAAFIDLVLYTEEAS